MDSLGKRKEGIMTDEDEVIDDPPEPHDDPNWLGPESYEGTGGDPK